MPATIRKANLADAAAIAWVHVSSWKTTYQGIVSDDFLSHLSVNNREDRWRDILAALDRESFVFVAEENGQVVGFISGMREREMDPVYSGEVGGIYLLQEAQRRGIGQQLMRTAAGELIERGHKSMLLWVLKDNSSARKFYEALGGRYLREKTIQIGDQTLPEVAYGWLDLNILSKE